MCNGIMAKRYKMAEAKQNKLTPLLTKRDVSEHLGVGVTTLNRYLREGKFPQGFRLPNGHLRWTQETVVQTVEAMKTEAKSA